MRSIKTKILSIYIFLISLIFLVAFVSIYNLYSLNKAVDGLIASNYRSIVAAQKMLDALERQDSYELIFMQVEPENTIKSFYENQNEFITYLTKAKDNITETEELKVIEKVSSNYITYSDQFLKLQEIKSSSGIEAASNFYNNEIYPVFLSVKKGCSELLEVNETAMFNSKQKAADRSNSQIYITAYLSLLVILIGLVVALAYTRKIVNPLNKLIFGVKALKEGNLNQEIEVLTRDEVGELALEFNNMTKRLLLYEKSNIKNLITEKNKSLAIVKSISDPVIVTDNNYNIILVNKSSEHLFNISEKDCVGRHILESINNEIIFNQIKHISMNNEDTESDKIITFKHANKAHYYILTTASIFDNENGITGAVTVLRDITQLKETEQMKTDLLWTISHELRTPLTSIVMGTGFLLDSSIGDLNEDQKEIVKAMDEDGNQLLKLISDLLDLSRLDSGKMQMNYGDLSIKELIDSSIKSFITIAEDKGVKICFNYDESLPLIKADSNKIKCVLNNLIINALKFTGSGDKIEIQAKLDNDFIKVVVSDTGCGIPKEHLESIFEKFVQLNNPPADIPGTGLGLAISKEFIKMHGGNIWAESNIGCGSSFIFTLPLKYI